MKMVLDAGFASIRSGRNDAPPGCVPKTDYSTIKFESYYAEKTVGVNRYWTALSHNDRSDLVIEILRCGKISTADQCILSSFVDTGVNGKYKILQVQHLQDEDGRMVTDLTLERIGDYA